MEPEIYAALDAHVRLLARDLSTLRAELDAASPAATAAPAAMSQRAVPPAPVAPAPAPDVATARPVSIENVFAGRGLQLIGALLVLLGTAFFLNLAFTRGWIGPAERIVLGLVCGLALVGAGARTLRTVGTPISEGLVGLGAGILYLSLWASVAVFPQLHVSRSAAFVAMVAVTGVLVLLAARRRSERVALLGLVGGFLTPVLLSNGPPERMVLAAYLLILGSAFAALGVRARFRIAEIAAFVASMLYLPEFVPVDGSWSPSASYAVATALFAVFAVAFSLEAFRDRANRTLQLALLASNAAVYTLMLSWIFRTDQTSLGVALIVLSAAALAAARFVPVRGMLASVYAYIGVAAATLALPALLHDFTLLDSVAFEGALLVVVGTRQADRPITIGGATLLAIATLWLLVDTLITPPTNTAFSSLTLAYAIVTAAFVLARTQLSTLLRDHPSLGEVLAFTGVAVNAIAVVGISRMLLDAFGGPAWTTGVPSQAQVAVSVAWTAYATVLFGIGLSRRSALLQREGLILLAITILKVFAVDLANVDLA
jgi:uncharacterized membrane protein